MVVSLATRLECNARLLEKIVLNDAAFDLISRIEAYLDEFAKSTGIVISDGLCIAYLIKIEYVLESGKRFKLKWHNYSAISYKSKYIYIYILGIIILIIQKNLNIKCE